MYKATFIKKLRGVSGDKNILNVLCKYLDDDIVKEVKLRRIGGNSLSINNHEIEKMIQLLQIDGIDSKQQVLKILQKMIVK